MAVERSSVKRQTSQTPRAPRPAAEERRHARHARAHSRRGRGSLLAPRLLGRDDPRSGAGREGRHRAAALLLRHQARAVRRGVRAPRGDHQSRAHRFDRRVRAARRRLDHRRRRDQCVPAADPAARRAGRSALAQLFRADRAGEQHAGVGRRDHGAHVRPGDSSPDPRAAQGAARCQRRGAVLELSLPVGRADAVAVADRPYRPPVEWAVQVERLRIDRPAHGAVHRQRLRAVVQTRSRGSASARRSVSQS